MKVFTALENSGSSKIQDVAAAVFTRHMVPRWPVLPIAVLSCPPARGVLRLLLAAVSAAITCSEYDNVCVSACRLLATAAAIVSLGTKHSGSDSVHKQPLTHVGEALSQQSDRPVFMFVPCAPSGKAL